MTSIFSDSWINIVFDGRNQQYGAYELRRITEKNILFALFVSTALLSVGLNIILLKNNPSAMIADNKEDKGTIELHDIPFVPNFPKEDPIVQQRTPKTPVSNTAQKFTVPQIIDDALLIDTVPTQDDFEHSEAGAKTGEGDSTLTASIETSMTGQGIVEKTDEPKTWVEQMPEFPGGDNALNDYLHKNTKYPWYAIENGMEGTAYVQFVVDRDGSLTNITIGKGTYKCLNDEALRVVQSMPKFKPGRQNGEPVRVRYVVPIKFALD